MRLFSLLFLTSCYSLELQEGARSVMITDKSFIKDCSFIESSSYTFFSEILFKNDAYKKGTNRVVVLESSPDFYYIQFYSCPLR